MKGRSFIYVFRASSQIASRGPLPVVSGDYWMQIHGLVEDRRSASQRLS
jgi:hypothetical protein